MMSNTAKPDAEPDFNKMLNGALGVLFKDIVKVALTNPSQSVFFLKTLRWQKKAAKTRAKWESQGLHVPPILVISVTSKCNLHCEGCYHQALRSTTNAEMSDERIWKLVDEAKELGISFVVLAGGEPLMRPHILDLSRESPEILFMMFTNGLLIDDAVLKEIAKNKNVVPLLSLEGYEIDTDGRRGSGVYNVLLKSIHKLKDKGLFWGASITMTRTNFDEVTDDGFIKQLVDSGCKLFMLTEYTPVIAGTEDWILTEEQKARVIGIRNAFRKKYPALFIALPWDEDEIGGCLSAGRGFVHISAEGNVEPCPFIAYSDTNLKDMPLKEALQSKMLLTIRENFGEFKEIQGCALWEKREWVQSLAKPSEKSGP
ncbi:MAG: radical SAM/SPASM domain-containing protein [Candidatus Bathyarchaeia archaeon]